MKESEPRSKIELVQVLLDNMDSLSTGLCSLVYCLYNYNYGVRGITRMESIIITNLLDKTLPKRRFKKTGYVWKKGSKKPRIKFLQSLIEKLKQDGI